MRLTELSVAWMCAAVLVVDGKAPSRHFWWRWMGRALTPHEKWMTPPHVPIAANDIAPEDGEAERMPTGPA